ncbi:MAG: hypothetical protein J1F38_05395 [Muribaculaceae bacterium]|nr:hypothetical protein [Muribaculaceae bacterium]
MRVDGRGYHGGLTDRFKGAVSWWNYCRQNNVQFKLFYVYPFLLTDYVVPNEYDWTIDEKEIPDSIFNTRIFYGRGENGKRLSKFKTNKNIWYYGNIDIGNTLHYPPYSDDWGASFRKLFKPSPLLENALSFHRNAIGGKFVAAVFRFQNLLGDFNEGKFYRKIKNKEEVQKLIQRNLSELERIRSKHPDLKILVTSDSFTFLEEAEKKDYVRVVKEKISHMEFSKTDVNHTQLKSFLDFFMIGEAVKVYSIVIGDMYKSDFPVYAAKAGGVPFERIERP